MKKSLYLIVFGMFLFLFTAQKISACEIEFVIDGSPKAKYHKGDELVVKVKVTFTHRVCTTGIKQTKFEGKGLQILQGTDWVETSPGVWERKLKIKITDPKKGKAVLSATRTCDKEGGFGSITIQTE
ncbi:MAG: hypothetical protein Kow0068_08510 [Marinilabiliales bacterium]